MRFGVAIALLVFAAAPAAADKADKLFNKAKRLHAEKKYAEACPTYEEVDRTDPGIGAKLNVAKCFEDWGRLATAYRWYTDAEQMAVSAKDDRVAKIKELIAELDTNVPRMTIKVPDGADPDVLDTLTLDGKPVPEDWLNTEQRVDPGPHVLEFVVDGQKKKKMAPVERGGESELSLDIPKGVGTKPRKKKTDGSAPEPLSTDPGKTRRLVGISVGGAGVLAVGVAAVVTLSARGKYKDALEANCMGSTSMCDPIGLRDTRDARSTANVATVITLVGVAAIAGGAVLYFTAPKAAKTNTETNTVYVSPTLDPTGGGFVVGGTF